MIRLRILLAWLLLAALPLQGFAAATMLLCGPAPRAAMQAAAAAPEQAGSAHGAHGAHGDAHHGHGPQHAQVHPGAADSPDAPGHAAHAPAAIGDETTAHSCGLCAANCHSLGIPASAPVLSTPHLPPPLQATVVVAVHTRSTPVPDKPPRA